MKLAAKSFSQGGKIPSKHTCDGSDISPELHISGVPAHAVSLVLIIDDPDVPSVVRADQMWDHWVVFNLSPTTTLIPENTQPPGTPGKNTFGNLVYQGPCPPDREHRYFFKLYALDTMLSLKAGASKKEVEQAMQGHILAQTELIGRYERSKPNA
jgi:Raf kinase inhibitor-like YbhB/YbcL family protein